MDEMEILAQWHDSRADFWRVEAIAKLPTWAAEHTAAAATIRAAMAENARLRNALFLSIQKHEGCDNIECVDTFSEVCHCRAAYYAALAAQNKEPTDAD